MRLRRRPRGNMPLLSMNDVRSVRLRPVYGYVGEIKFIDDEPGDLISFDSPALVAVVVKLWWRYGNSWQEQFDSWISCRIFTR